MMTDKDDAFLADRESMVEIQIRGRGIQDEKVLRAMRTVPRHLFVPDDLKHYAYADEPLPIGEGQTISQPYIVAYMTEALHLGGDESVLEIGTGSGYQTAVLAEIVREVFTIEIIGQLSQKAQETLGKLGYVNVRFRVADGTFGWPDYSPYDGVIVTAASPTVPKRLQEQLKMKGKMIIPVGSGFQELILITREKDEFKKKKLLPVRFVPLISTH